MGGGIARGIAIGYLSLIVLVPLAALVWSSRSHGLGAFWNEITKAEAASALKLTLVVSLLVAAFNAMAGTAIAWVLVRDSFPGKGFVNAVIDLPFALPTIVAGLVLLQLYGPNSPFGVDLAFQRTGLVLALLFVTLPFVVRAVQPVLLELDREMEEAAESLGARRFEVFRRIVFPNLLPAILSGVALAFARAVGEFGSVVLISGNIPFKTEVSSVYISGQIESDNAAGAAAVSVVLLLISLAVLLGIGAFRHWRTREASLAMPTKRSRRHGGVTAKRRLHGRRSSGRQKGPGHDR
jgi:sulfate/thiosulfate transport system permease protein